MVGDGTPLPPRSIPSRLLAAALALSLPGLGAEPLFNGRDLQGWHSWLVDTHREDPRQVFSVTNGLIRISGDDLNGTYRGTVTVPGYIAADTWDSSITVNDALLNSRSHNTIFLGEPFPGGGTGRIVVQNSGAVDGGDPVLTAYSFSPSTVDVGPGNQFAKVVAQAAIGAPRAGDVIAVLAQSWNEGIADAVVIDDHFGQPAVRRLVGRQHAQAVTECGRPQKRRLLEGIQIGREFLQQGAPPLPAQRFDQPA